VFALQTCSHCKSVKKLLQECKVPFQTIYLDLLTGEERNDTLRRIRRINPSVSFPTLQVGDAVVVGFKQDAIKAALAASS
jgi:glutaredoxin